MSPFVLTIVRFLSGFVVLLVLSSIKTPTFARGRAGKKDIVGGALLGVYAFAISYGYLYITAAAGSFVFFSIVVVTMSAFSVIVEKERLTWPLLAGSLLGILGVLIINFGGITSVTSIGVALMAATGISWALYSSYGKKFFGTYFEFSFWSFLVLGILMLLAALVTLPIQGLSQWDNISSTALGLALFMGTATTALSYITWNRLLRKIKTSQGGLVQLLVPVITSVLGLFLLSEAFTPTLLIGGSVILIGIYLVSFL